MQHSKEKVRWFWRLRYATMSMRRWRCDDRRDDASIDDDDATIDNDYATIDDDDATIDNADVMIDDGDVIIYHSRREQP